MSLNTQYPATTAAALVSSRPLLDAVGECGGAATKAPLKAGQLLRRLVFLFKLRMIAPGGGQQNRAEKAQAQAQASIIGH